MLDFKLVHVGINCQSEDEAKSTTAKFMDMFGWAQKVGNSSVFAGTQIECMKAPFKGAMGHIAVSTPNVRRAVFQLEQKGVKFDMDSAKYDADGRMTVIYLADEFSGFAIHLVEAK